MCPDEELLEECPVCNALLDEHEQEQELCDGCLEQEKINEARDHREQMDDQRRKYRDD